jgi:hypothetical protein
VVQVKPHDVPLQVAVPFAGAVHGVVHEAPHVATAVFDTQVPPQSWNPVLHAMPQAVPLQVAVPFAGVGQAAQEVIPQVAGLVFAAHWPAQMCMPEAHEQAFALGMQAPAHSFIPEGQAGIQVVPSQVTVPPVGA